MDYNLKVGYIYNFDPEKNNKLIEYRGVSFEEVISILENKGPIETIQHYNNKYIHQKIYVIEIKNYVYLVPFVEDNNKIFLKTIFPHRKMTRKYLNK